jgi:ribosomal protein L7/L12
MKISFEGTMEEFHEFAEKMVHLRRLEERRGKSEKRSAAGIVKAILVKDGRAGLIHAIKAYREAVREKTGETPGLKESKDAVEALLATIA